MLKFILYSTQYFFLTLNSIVCHSTFSCNSQIIFKKIIAMYMSDVLVKVGEEVDDKRVLFVELVAGGGSDSV